MLIDLGMPLDPSTPVYPGDPPFDVEEVFTVAEHGCRVRRLSFSSHFGTHVDTPCHMIAGGKTLDAFPLTTLIGPACVLDLRGRDPITEHDLPATLPAPRVLLLTGHSDHWHDPNWHDSHPTISESAARRLVELGAILLGIDSHGFDSPPWPVHHIILGGGILLVENLVGLHRLPPTFQLIVAPLPLFDADGSPARVIADTGAGW
jgi:arylformamidase